MCGRYYIDDETAREIQKLVHQAQARLAGERLHGERLGGEGLHRERLSSERLHGDIYPAGQAPVIVGNQGEEFAQELFSWGFPGFQKKGVIFNARSETVLEKRMFQESFRLRRCVIPAKAFYEWDSGKNKFTFVRDDKKTLFFAGFYNLFEDRERFVILTTQANESMRLVHERMPLILEENELKDWVFDLDMAKRLLRQIPVELERSTEYVQQTLKF